MLDTGMAIPKMKAISKQSGIRQIFSERELLPTIQSRFLVVHDNGQKPFNVFDVLT